MLVHSCVHTHTQTHTHVQGHCLQTKSQSSWPGCLCCRLCVWLPRAPRKMKEPSSPQPKTMPTSRPLCPKGLRPELQAGPPRAWGQWYHRQRALDHQLPPHSSHAPPSRKAFTEGSSLLWAFVCPLTKVTSVATASGAKTLQDRVINRGCQDLSISLQMSKVLVSRASHFFN